MRPILFPTLFQAISVTCAAIATGLWSDAVAEVLIAKGDSWSYLDDGSNQGTAWREPGFDDSGWKSGKAEFGYGDGDEATLVAFGISSRRHITTYFRKVIVIPEETRILDGTLTAELLVDDGAIVYLNGVLAIRSSMPEGEVRSSQLATATIGDEDETKFAGYLLDSSLLRSGQNTVAVEVHQASATSSDLGFDFRLTLAKPTHQRLSLPTFAAGQTLRSGHFDDDRLEDVVSDCWVCTTVFSPGTDSGEGSSLPRKLPIAGSWLANGDLDGDGIDEILHFPQSFTGADQHLLLAHYDQLSGWRDVLLHPTQKFNIGSGGAFSDFDGDGRIDIAVGGWFGAGPALFLNRGGLDFAEPIAIWGDSANFTVMAAGDFDGNRLSDLMIVDNEGRWRLLQTEPGVYSDPVPLRQFGPDNALIATLDVNGDGRADLLTDDGYLVTNQSGSAGPVRTAFNATRYLAAHDFDSDGDPDLLAIDADERWLVWQVNGGTAGFTDQVLVARDVEAYSGLVADLNGDGVGDIVLRNFGPDLTVFLSVAPEVPVVESFASSPASLTARGSATLSWRVRGADRIRIDHGIGEVSAEGGAAVELRETTEFTLEATAPGGARTTERLLVAMPLFQNPVALELPELIRNQQGLGGGDLDGDGVSELFYADSFARRLFILDVAEGSLVERRSIEIDADIVGNLLRVLDLDGDGTNDLLFNERQWFRGNGEGRFAFGLPISDFNHSWNGIEFADLDGDGDLDGVVATGDFRLGICRNPGAGQVFDPTQILNDGPARAAALDADGDGDLDLATTEEIIILQDWGVTNRIPFNTDGLPQGVSTAAGDIDGDGDDDLIADPWIYRSRAGALDLARPEYFAAPNQPYRLADMDGDGDLDVFGIGSPGVSYGFWRNVDGKGSFRAEPGISEEEALFHLDEIAWYDVDGDGDDDAIVDRTGRLEYFWVENVGASARSPDAFLLTIAGAGDGLRLEWSSEPGETFTVEHSPDLEHWQNAIQDGGTVTAMEGETTTLTIERPSGARAWFRVRR